MKLETLNLEKTDISSLISESREMENMCKDYTVTKANSNNFMMQENGNIRYHSDNAGIKESPISKFAFSQLCNKLGIPSTYIIKCTNTGRLSLARDNVSSWLDDFNSDLLIREYDHSIRGILTPRYSVLDTSEVLDVIQDVFGKEDLVTRGYFLTPERFHLRMTGKRKLPVDGEDLFAGFTVNSSDVGRSALSVCFFIFKQVCTNGLCIPKNKGMLFEQKHIGISCEQFRKNLQENLELIPQITKQVVHSIEEKRNSDAILTSMGNDMELEALINQIRLKTNLSVKGATQVVELFQNRVFEAKDFRYENNQWGLINALTETAKTYTLESRIDLESVAGLMVA